MSVSITLGGHTFRGGAVPNVCPQCHVAMVPEELVVRASVGSGYANADVEAVFRCGNNECARIFIARYVPTWNQRVGSNRLEFIECVPRSTKPRSLPEEVKELSPDFCRILEQADTGDSLGLSDIAGVGYRKALEFLVKDYCVKYYNVEAEIIEHLPLGTCINNYVTDPKIKESARRAVWLGNDEAHYVRRWEGKNIGTLKMLLDLTVTWIHSELLYSEMLDEMPEPEKEKGKPS